MYVSSHDSLLSLISLHNLMKAATVTLTCVGPVPLYALDFRFGSAGFEAKSESSTRRRKRDRKMACKAAEEAVEKVHRRSSRQDILGPVRNLR